MVSLRGVEVNIFCEDQKLPMYGEAFDGTTATAYIASYAGKASIYYPLYAPARTSCTSSYASLTLHQKFSVNLHNAANADLGYTISLDGKYMGSWVSTKGNNNKGHIRGSFTSFTTLRPFEFAVLQVAGGCLPLLHVLFALGTNLR